MSRSKEVSEATWRARGRGALEEIEQALELSEVASDPQYALDVATKALREAQRWLTSGRQVDRRRSQDVGDIHRVLDEMVSLGTSEESPLDDTPEGIVEVAPGEPPLGRLESQMHEAISEAWQDLSPSIAEFLLDRIEGQEGVAHREPNDHRSAAVLAEAKAKRRIVHEWRLAKAKADSGDLSGQIASIGLSIAMKALVQPYAGRPDAPSYASYPDFRPEWRLEPLDD